MKKSPIVSPWIDSLVRCVETCSSTKEMERVWRGWQSWAKTVSLHCSSSLAFRELLCRCCSAITEAGPLCFISQFLHLLFTSYKSRSRNKSESEHPYKISRQIFSSSFRISWLLRYRPGSQSVHKDHHSSSWLCRCPCPKLHPWGGSSGDGQQTNIPRKKSEHVLRRTNGLLSGCHWFGTGPVWYLLY